MSLQDEQLVGRVLSGDKSAFGVLVERYQSAAYGLAFHILGNFAEAQDAAQEAFLRAYSNLHTLKDPTKFPSWLQGIVRNICLSWRRSRKALSSIEEVGESSLKSAQPPPDEELERRILWERVMRAIEGLSEKNRLVVTLYYIDGLSYREIADFLDISVNTVKDRLRRARRKLKEKMLQIVEEEFERYKLTPKFKEEVSRAIEGLRNVTLLSVRVEGEERETSSELREILDDVAKRYDGMVNEKEGSLLAIFGVRTSHEDDPERAILSALELRERSAELDGELRFKASVTTGMAEIREERCKLMGDALRSASDLIDAASDGMIIVSPSAYRLSKGRFVFRELKRGDLQAYEVVTRAEHPRKVWDIDGFASPMIGRDGEFAKLRRYIDRLLEGEGRIVSIIGEAGIGKSRITSELRGHAEEKGVTWLEGRCISYGQRMSYTPFLEVMREFFEIRMGDSDDEIRRKIEAKSLRFCPSAQEDIIPYMLNFLSGMESKEISRLTAEQLRYKTFIAIRTLLRNASTDKPMVVAIEDLQWIDEASYELLTFLMTNAIKFPILFLSIYRPERDKLCWQFRKQASTKYPDRYDEIALFRLSSEESRQLLEEILKRKLPSSVEERILRKAEGNPLFLEEIIRALANSGKLVQREEGWELIGEVDEIEVPDTVFSVISSRIDGLGEVERDVLGCASVIGDIFPEELLGAVFGDVDEKSIRKLEELDFLVRDELKGEYRFKHVLIKEVMYSSLLPEIKGELHGKIAEAIERLYGERLEEFYEVLAHHWRHTGNIEKRVEYLLKAGRKAKWVYSNGDAVNYLEEALKLLDEDDARRAKAYEDLGEVYYILGEHNKAVPALERAITLALKSGENPLELASIYFKFAWGLIWLGRYDEAISQARSGLEKLGDDLINPQATLLSQAIATAYYCKSDPKSAEEYLLKNTDIIGKLGYFDLIHKVYEGIAQIAYSKGEIDSAIRWQRENERICEKHGNAMGEGEACIYLGRYMGFKGELREAIRCYEKGLKACEKSGYVNFILLGNIWLGEALHLLGRDEEAEAHFLKAVEVADVAEGIRRRFTGFTSYYLGRFYCDVGDFERAIKPLEKALRFSKFEEGRAEEGVLISLAALERAYLSLGKEDEFKGFCRKVIPEIREKLRGLKLEQYHLVKGKPSDRFTKPYLLGAFNGGRLSPKLKWVDPRGDSGYGFFREQGWLEIYAASGCDLHGDNPDAPRLIIEVSGDFAVETRLKASSPELPSVGGISVWKGGDCLIQLERGIYEREEISFSLKEEGVRRYVGRGILPASDVILRMERIRDRFSAYCSDDGVSWMRCGDMRVEVDDPIQIGLHAIGGYHRRKGTVAAGRIDTPTCVLYKYFNLFFPATP